MLYNMGYPGYANPYYGMGGAGLGGGGVPTSTAPTQGVAYDYSQPIDTAAQPAQQSATDAAEVVFDQSRTAFMSGDYGQSLSLCAQAIKTLPNDPAIHEFRGLVLFALKRYDEAAGTLYAVLSAAPGWDWTTMISLYPNVDVYASQLRALEVSMREKPDSAAAKFVLAYHYLAQGHNDAAVMELQKVVKLQPNDTLSAKLVELLTKQDQTPTASPPPAETAPPKNYDVTGTWSASPANDVATTLMVQKDGAFVWKVKEKRKSRELSGKSTYGNELLMLSGAQVQPLVGKSHGRMRITSRFKSPEAEHSTWV
jgi:tetratricopeptide (TPR) repeat protein